MPKPTIRTLDAVKDWPPKGQTPDQGAGSRARAALKNLTGQRKELAQLESVYARILAALRGLSTDQQRAVLFAAASDYTWPSLVKKAALGRSTTGKLTVTEQKQFEAIRREKGEEQAQLWKELTLDAKANVRAFLGGKK